MNKHMYNMDWCFPMSPMIIICTKYNASSRYIGIWNVLVLCHWQLMYINVSMHLWHSVTRNDLFMCQLTTCVHIKCTLDHSYSGTQYKGVQIVSFSTGLSLHLDHLVGPSWLPVLVTVFSFYIFSAPTLDSTLTFVHVILYITSCGNLPGSPFSGLLVFVTCHILLLLFLYHIYVI